MFFILKGPCFQKTHLHIKSLNTGETAVAVLKCRIWLKDADGIAALETLNRLRIYAQSDLGL